MSHTSPPHPHAHHRTSPHLATSQDPLSAEAAALLKPPQAAGSWDPSCEVLRHETRETALRRVPLTPYDTLWRVQETEKEKGKRRPSPRLIPCPVLAAMYTGGSLIPDAEGRVSMVHVREAMRDGIGSKPTMATTIARGSVV